MTKSRFIFISLLRNEGIVEKNAFDNEDFVEKENLAEYENMSDYEMLQRKKWLFKENIRLQELARTLEDERKLIEIQKGMLERQQTKSMIMRKQLEDQKSLFDQQWKLLEIETKKLAVEKDKFNREKLMYKDQVYREARRSMINSENIKMFFKGVDDSSSLKRRYKSLLKIYHPDNSNGDKAILQAINEEYERLLRFYLGT